MDVSQQIVNAVVPRVTGLATSGTRVFAERPEAYPLAETEVPAVLVFDDGESVDADGGGLNIEALQVNVRLQLVTKAVAGAAATVRQMRAEVRQALVAPLTIGSSSVPLFYEGTDMEESAQSDRPVVRATLRFRASLFASTPETLA